MAYIGSKPADKVLTASDITDGVVSNAKLAQDIISADTALGAEPADTDELLVSDAGVLKRMDYSYIKGGGKFGQIVQTVKTDVTSTTSTTYEDMSGMSRTITPTAASSKILIIPSLLLGNSGGIAYHVQRDVDSGGYSTITAFTGDAAGSRERAAQGGNWSATAASFSGMYLDTPTYSLTDVITYKLQWTAENGTLYLNQGTNDADSSYHVRSASTLTLIEVLA